MNGIYLPGYLVNMAICRSNFSDNCTVTTLMYKLQKPADGIQRNQYACTRIHFHIALPHIRIDIRSRFSNYCSQYYFFARLSFRYWLQVDKLSAGWVWFQASVKEVHKSNSVDSLQHQNSNFLSFPLWILQEHNRKKIMKTNHIL